MSKRVVTLNEDQFQAVYELVSDRVDYLVERSIDLQDSEILDDYGNLLDVHTILEFLNLNDLSIFYRSCRCNSNFTCDDEVTEQFTIH